MNLLSPVLGGLLLLLLMVDVFVTVFHPEGHGGPVTRWQSRLTWRVWRGLAPRGGGRDGWLALGGPSLALLAPVTWAVLLIGGFALVYVPWMDRFLVSPGILRHTWVEAIYFSGIAAVTLGTGDIVPDLPALRLLSVLEALSGFALITAALSYILSVYRENGRAGTLAAELSLRYSSVAPAEAVPLGEREQWLDHVAREILHITRAHAQYPILLYFRPRDPSGSLPLQLGALVRSGSDTALAATAGGSLSGERLVRAAVSRYLDEADVRILARSGASTEGRDSLERRHARLLDYLGYSTEGP